MKNIILILILFTGIELQAQEAKNTFTVSGILAHFDQITKYHSAKVVPGYYEYPVDPGVEILYYKKSK